MPCTAHALLLALCTSSLANPGACASDASDFIVALDRERIQIAGTVLVNRADHTVRIPAVVNQDHGPVEYLLVHTTGKRHESVFTTAIEPRHLHLACLLAGAPETDAAAQPVRVEVTWQGHGPEVHLPPEALLLPATHEGQVIAGAAVPAGGWIYSASRFERDGFAAQSEGSCIALQADSAALMQAAALQTMEFVPDDDRLPAIGTPVTIVLTFGADCAKHP